MHYVYILDSLSVLQIFGTQFEVWEQSRAKASSRAGGKLTTHRQDLKCFAD